MDYPDYLTFELDLQAAVRSGAVPGEDDPLGRVIEQAIEHLGRLDEV